MESAFTRLPRTGEVKRAAVERTHKGSNVNNQPSGTAH